MRGHDEENPNCIDQRKNLLDNRMPGTFSRKKTWCKGTTGTNDRLYINQQIVKKVKKRRENVAMTCLTTK